MTKIEEVARAIWEACRKNETEYIGEYQKVGFPPGTTSTAIAGDFDLELIAMAAIEAMRRPTTLIDDVEFMDKVLADGERVARIRETVRCCPKSVAKDNDHLGDLAFLLKQLDAALEE